MTDKELLELAAKAAGMVVCNIYWNPFTDDGDALRLAVKLKMDVTFNAEDVFTFPPDGSEGIAELINVDDPYAATRRAIVRAAAEVGRGIAQSLLGDVPEDNYYKTQAEIGNEMK